MIDWQKRLLDPLYSKLGKPAVLTVGENTDAVTVSVSVIDKTNDVSVGEIIQVHSANAVAAVRMKELTANGVTRDTINGAEIAFNNQNFRVKAHITKPSPDGIAAGELYLILEDMA